MADENKTDDVEELGVEEVSGVTEEVSEQVETATEAVEEETEASEETVEAALSEADALVETAVRHVAEEAEADFAEASADDEDAPEPKRRERRSKQARADKTSRSASPLPQEPAKASPAGRLSGLGVPAWLGISAACLVLGLVLGRFVLGGSPAASVGLAGKTTVTEAELDDAYATYTYNGTTNQISVREVIEQSGSLDAALTADGTYTLPSAEYAVNAARTAILNSEVESRGITVSDEDAAAYAEQALGTSDYDAIASTYGMDAESVKDLILENCRLNALREEVVGSETPAMPEAPAAADEGKEDELTKEYADYIIGLAGDEWDGDKDAWASDDGRYAIALDGYEVRSDGASYTAAQAAYYVAYQLYSEQQTEMGNRWSEFLNGLLSNASIQVGTLIS